MEVLIVLAIVLLVLVTGWGVWRRFPLPCPSWLAWLLDNPFTSDYQAKVLARLDLREGLAVLDAGCGPGRLTIPIARAVGPKGKVLAVDIQERMIGRARDRAAEAGLTNVDFLVAPLGAGKIPREAFDRAVMVTVLGEIPDKLSALKEVFESLRPGGFLAVTEVLPDPHFQPFGRLQRLAASAGFQAGSRHGGPLAFTANLIRPRQDG